MKEIWKDVTNYEGLYKISTKGKIINIKRNHVMKQSKDKDGYNVLSLTNKYGKRKMYKVHRLVALAFIENKNNLFYINHKNEIKNDNRVENLEWCTAKYNNTYGKRISKLNKKVGKYDKNNNLLETFNSVKEARKIYKGNISGCCRGKVKTVGGFIWKYE